MFLLLVGTSWSRLCAIGLKNYQVVSPGEGGLVGAGAGNAFVTIASCQLVRVIFLAGPVFPPRDRTKNFWPRHRRLQRT